MARTTQNRRRKGDNQPIRETTKDKYRQYVRDYLNPVLGDLPMASIKPAHIRDWYDSMKVTKDGRGESIRRHVFELLSAIMAEATNASMDDQGTTLIKVNPVQFKVPRPATKHVYVIATREQVRALADGNPTQWGDQQTGGFGRLGHVGRRRRWNRPMDASRPARRPPRQGSARRLR
ncbi:integrase [Bifidobacterium hapali]|uniref:Integrase n=1 Tax=Bifidobacterium hapali TaxID=1630172 RepID=A0A261FZ50_9BIFI|nr:N-terminal phage integrase SAM-like domain-containing protein [Bifidobacterium hapali]OZG64398.1 integrase [Bifidobacterium hapali]